MPHPLDQIVTNPNGGADEMHSAATATTGAKELIFLFDDEKARMHMTIERTCLPCDTPTEQSILSIWKRAAQTLNETITTSDAISCIIKVYPNLNRDHNNNQSGSAGLPTGLDSKRQVLEYASTPLFDGISQSKRSRQQSECRPSQDEQEASDASTECLAKIARTGEESILECC
jgi:hypothetical protein